MFLKTAFSPEECDRVMAIGRARAKGAMILFSNYVPHRVQPVTWVVGDTGFR